MDILVSKPNIILFLCINISKSDMLDILIAKISTNNSLKNEAKVLQIQGYKEF